MFTIDAHLDLSMNALEWNRDLRLSAHQIRARETGLTDKPDRANGTVSLPDLRRGNVGLVVATQIARYVAPGNKLPGWHSPEQAWAQTQGQLAWYRAMEEAGEMVPITDRASLEKHLALWLNDSPNTGKPVGYILSLEGADSLVTVGHLERGVSVWAAGGWAGALWPRPLRTGHRCHRLHWRTRPRTARRNGTAEHHLRCYPSVRR